MVFEDGYVMSGGSGATLALLVVTYPLLRIFYNLYLHPLAGIPGPLAWSATRLPFIQALLKGTIVHDFEKLHRKYGPILRIAPNEVTFANAEAWDDIFRLRSDHHQFLKDPTWWERQPGHPESLLSAIDPEPHARIRGQLAPAFTTRALNAQEPIVQKYVNLLVERLRERIIDEDKTGKGVVVDIAPWFHYTTFDIFGDLGFGESFECLEHSRFHPWIALLFKTVKAAAFVAAARFYPIIEALLMKCIPASLKKTQADHYQQIVDKVQRRLNWELERPDIMSHLIKSNGEIALPIGEVNATFMILTTAGSETTATVLGGAINYLVNNPDKLSIATEEIRAAFQKESDFTFRALQNLKYLNAMIDEALRLCPPVPWMLPRLVPPGGDTVSQVWLPEGTRVSIQAYSLNRDPNYFHSASSFIPERWLPESSNDPTSPFFNDRRDAIKPFSVGPRSCLGQHLARAEMRLIMAKLLWTFDFEAVKGKELQWEDLRTFLLIEKKPINVRMKLRLP